MSVEHELATARAAVERMAAQLADLHAERDGDCDGGARRGVVPSRQALVAMVASLDAQVCALIDEKIELERRLAAYAAHSAATGAVRGAAYAAA